MDTLTTKDFITIGISTFSLCVSAIALFISYKNYRLNEASFRRAGDVLTFSLDYRHQGNYGSFLLTITNSGFKPISISNISMIRKNEVIPAIHDQLNIESYGKIPIKISLAGHDFHPSEVTAIEVIDVTGKSFRVSTKPLRKKMRG